MNKSSISTRLLFSFLFISLLPLTVVGFLAYHHAERALKQEVMAGLNSSLEAKKKHLQQFILEKERDIAGLAATPAVINAMKDFAAAYHEEGGISGEEYAGLEQKHRPFFRQYQRLRDYDLFLISAAGDVVFSVTKEGNLGRNLLNGIFKDSDLALIFKTALKSSTVAISRFRLYDPSGEPTAFLAAPVTDPKGGGPWGVIALQLNANALYEHMTDFTGLGETGETVLGAREGDEVVFLTPLRHTPSEGFRKRVKIGSGEALPLQQAVKGESGYGMSTDYRGKEIVAVWNYFAPLKLGIVVKVDGPEAFASITGMRKTTFLIGGISALSVFFLAIYISRSISRPIQRLKRGVEIIGSGNLDYRIDNLRRDEIGGLASAFNDMAGKLKKADDELSIKNRISQAFLSGSDEYMQGEVLASILDALQSRYGMFGYIDGNSAVICSSMTRDVGEECRVHEKIIDYPYEVWGSSHAIWARAIREKKTLSSNNVTSFHMSEGHIPIEKSISCPIIQDKKVIGHFAIANKSLDYTEEDVESIEAVARHVAPLLHSRLEKKREETERKRAEKEVLKLNETLEERIQKRTEELQESEATLKEAQKIAKIGSWELNFKTDTLTWSDEMFTIFEIDHENFEISYETVLKKIHPDDRNSVKKAYKESIEKRTPYNIEYRMLMKAGQIKYLDERCNTSYDGEGNPLRLIGTVQDITERTLSAEKVREERDRATKYLEISGAMIVQLDAKGCITLINKKGLDLLGYGSEAEVIGKDWISTFLPERLREYVAGVFRELMAGNVKPVEYYENPVLRSNGEERVVYWHNAIQKDKQGKTYSILSSGLDITDLKKVEGALRKLNRELEDRVERRTEALEAANNRLKELDRLKSMFIASMSHELRTPLNSIIGFTGIILKGMAGEVNEEQHKQLTMVKGSAHHLLSLINDIIDVSKIEAGKVTADVSTFDLCPLLSEVKGSCHILAEEKGLALSLSMPKASIITSDRRRIKQVLVNLIGNAIKFTDKGSVEIVLKEEGASFRISVRDTGTGMNDDELSRLFQPFSRIHTAVKREGTGLGLYLSRKIAALLEGEITARSEPGTGSSFTLSLPVKTRGKEIG